MASCNSVQGQVEDFNAAGVEAYRRGRHEEAIGCFDEALLAASTAATSRAAILKNRAAAKAALQLWPQVEDDLTAALACASGATRQQCFLKRSYARAQLERHDLALADAEAAGASAAAVAQARRCRSAIAADRAALRGADEDFGRRLVHTDQTLRLVFASELPRAMAPGASATVTVRLTNEFGLWRACDWPSVARGTVFVEMTGLDAEPVEMRADGRAVFEATAPRGQSRTVARVAAAADGPWLRRPLAVLSPPIYLEEESSTDFDDGGSVDATSCREIAGVVVAEAIGSLGIGGKLWDASLALLAYLEKHDAVRGRRVLELGSGVGLVGIACAARFGAADVFLTDRAEVVPLLELNIKLNGCRNVAARELDWTSPNLEGVPRADVVVSSDVVYDLALHEPLLATLETVVSGFQPDLVLLAHRHRNPHDGAFFIKLHRNFRVDALTVDSSPDVPADVALFRLHPR